MSEQEMQEQLKTLQAQITLLQAQINVLQETNRGYREELDALEEFVEQADTVLTKQNELVVKLHKKVFGQHTQGRSDPS